MGLDTTHDCWHGPYSSFNNWRREVAAAAGLPPLDEMYNWGGPILWSSLPAGDVLYELLDHSDCEGELRAEICGPLADRLEGLLPMVGADRNQGLEPRVFSKLASQFYKGQTEQFIKGLREAAKRGEAVEFH